MQISVSARHGHLSEANQEKIRAKVEKLSKYFERLAAIEVTANLERPDLVEVEILVSAEHKHDFVATDSAPELIAAVDATIHKLEQQLRKYKEKVQDHHRSPGLRQSGTSATLPGEGD
ncbi:MAG: ribosome-associated translation inhibitor RaiA [Pirellulales bacterium]|nr:ribosome-associated translation inhibitor RaiA [Pirellulales bacterium]